MDDGNQVFSTGESAALLVLEFPSFRDFIDAYSPIISEEGIFIRNEDVSESNAFAVGDRVDFEVRLKDDFRLIQGSGEVVWLGPSQAAGGATGTAIRFHDVDEPSQRLIARLVGNYSRDGGALFELGEPSAEIVSSVGEESGDVDANDSNQPAGLAQSSAQSQLTAENLKPSEADELFSDEGETDATPLEFESVSLEDVQTSEDEEVPSPLRETDDPDAVLPRLEDPVGLDTIAIPSGLVAELASQAEAKGKSEDAPAPEVREEIVEEEELPAPLDLPALDESLPAVDSALSSTVDPALDFPVPPVEPPEEEKADTGSLEAVASSFDGSLGNGGISDDIVQVAEELSGVHRFDLPDNDEISGVDYAGSASVGSERNTGGRIAALSVVFVLLGAGAFYFGDTILSSLGWGGGEGTGATDEVVRAGEVMPPSATVEDETAIPAEPSAPSGQAESADSADSAQPVAAGAVEGPARATSGETDAGSDPGEGPAAVARNQQPPADGPSATSSPLPAPAVGGGVQPQSAPNAVETAVTRRVERITWSEQGDETVVTIRSNGEMTQDLVEVIRVRDGAPREVIKIRGVEVPYSPREMVIGSVHVLRLRTGLHRNASGSELHVVADLASAGVTLLSIEPRGRDLILTFA